MRPWLGIAVLAAALLPSAAAAQSAFDQRIAHWRISAGGASCMAFNRPAYELNAAPFNAAPRLRLAAARRWLLPPTPQRLPAAPVKRRGRSRRPRGPGSGRSRSSRA